MARKGPAPKDPARRQRRNGGKPKAVGDNVVQMPGAPKPRPPAAPAGLLPETRAAWVRFWKSDAAVRVQPEHMDALVQLYRDRDTRARLLKIVHKHPLSEGSTGQTVEHPLWKRIDALDKRIDRAVIEFGLTPLAAQKFRGSGSGGSGSGKSLDDITREIREAISDGDDDDPREADEA